MIYDYFRAHRTFILLFLSKIHGTAHVYTLDLRFFLTKNLHASPPHVFFAAPIQHTTSLKVRSIIYQLLLTFSKMTNTTTKDPGTPAKKKPATDCSGVDGCKIPAKRPEVVGSGSDYSSGSSTAVPDTRCRSTPLRLPRLTRSPLRRTGRRPRIRRR